jgi:peptidoglycan/LPS O-acetylase OafA/YrhL
MIYLNIKQLIVGPGFFRFMLAALVYVYHVSRLGIGRSAVYVFFTLSGYWICTMWIKRYQDNRNGYWIFLCSRFWRLAPVFILCSIITWLLLVVTPNYIPDKVNWMHQYFSNVMIVGYDMLSFQPNGPAWSLDIELQFYIVAPLLFYAMRKGIWVLVGCLLISVLAYFLDAREILLPYLVFFAIGTAAATFRWRPTKRLALLALATSAATFVLCIASPYRGILLGGVNAGPLYAFNDIFEILLAISMTPWALYTTERKGCRLDGMFGDLSFIVYLLHWPLINAMSVGVGSYPQRVVKICAAAILVYAFAWIIWRWFDRPIDDIRSRWVVRSLSPRTSSTSA